MREIVLLCTISILLQLDDNIQRNNKNASICSVDKFPQAKEEEGRGTVNSHLSFFFFPASAVVVAVRFFVRNFPIVRKSQSLPIDISCPPPPPFETVNFAHICLFSSLSPLLPFLCKVSMQMCIGGKGG